jgi:hypothetical protein
MLPVNAVEAMVGIDCARQKYGNKQMLIKQVMMDKYRLNCRGCIRYK